MKHALAFLVFCSAFLQAQEASFIDAKDLEAIKTHEGREATIQGVVTSVGTTQSNSITFLNMGPKKEGFVAVIFQGDYPNFPEGFEKYKNQMLRVKGFVSLYKSSVPQIKVTAPEQITIVTSE